jgi:hypothetical protein
MRRAQIPNNLMPPSSGFSPISSPVDCFQNLEGTLKMGAVGSSERLVTFYHTTLRHFQAGSNRHTQRGENLKPHEQTLISSLHTNLFPSLSCSNISRSNIPKDRLCGLVVRVPGYRTEMYCDFCEVRTEFMYVK